MICNNFILGFKIKFVNLKPITTLNSNVFAMWKKSPQAPSPVLKSMRPLEG